MHSKQIDLTPSLCIYAIHGQNPEIIEPEDNKFENCIIELIKCHHNEITKYIQELKFDNSFLSFSFRYYNFANFPTDYNQNKNMFFYACQYEYLSFEIRRYKNAF